MSTGPGKNVNQNQHVQYFVSLYYGCVATLNECNIRTLTQTRSPHPRLWRTPTDSRWIYPTTVHLEARAAPAHTAPARAAPARTVLSAPEVGRNADLTSTDKSTFIQVF